MSSAVGRLHPKAAVGPAVVVGYVVVENPFRMGLVLDDDVVEAVPAERTDHALGEGVCLGREAAWRGGGYQGRALASLVASTMRCAAHAALG